MLVPIIILVASIAVSFALKKVVHKILEKEFTFGNACLFILVSFLLIAVLFLTLVQLFHIHTALAIAFLVVYILV